MTESKANKLHELLKRLGTAIHRSVVDSDEVQSCLRDLHQDGWDAVMMLEASVACSQDGDVESEGASLHVHADPEPERVAYRLNLQDAMWLSSLGISPTRHRSTKPSPSPRPDAEPSRQQDDEPRR
jgi:hypothetical protein